MTETPQPAPLDADAIRKLADAVTQIAIVVEEVGLYAAQHTYTDVARDRRWRWQTTLRKQREAIAELIEE